MRAYFSATNLKVLGRKALLGLVFVVIAKLAVA
jgi:hypothetical protein